MSMISTPTMAVKSHKEHILFATLIIFHHFISSSHAELEPDRLHQGQELKDGDLLVSPGKVFELRFFTPTSSKRKAVGFFGPELLHNRYLGIFYKDSAYNRPVWIANRDTPIPGKSGSLMIDNNGVLMILQDGKSSIAISSRPKNETLCDVVLMDSGNLVLSEAISGHVLWQSFDHPTDTLLPGMRLGFRLGADDGLVWKLAPWVSDEVPATGSFTLGADPNGSDQLIIWRRGEVYWKSGIWSHGRFENLHDYTYKFDHKSDEQERVFVLSFVHDWRITSPVFMIDELGSLRKSDPEYPVNSNFSMTSLVDCHGAGVAGCVSFELPECHSKVKVRMMPGYKLSSGFKYDMNQSWSVADCGALCLSNCSCVAYASLYHNGTACELWTNRSQLAFDDKGYREIYVLLARPLGLKGLSSRLPTIAGAAISLLVFVSLTCICCFKGRDPNANAALNHLFYLLQRKVRAVGRRLRDEETSFVELETTTESWSTRFKRRRRLKILYYKSHGLRLFAFEVLIQATDGFSPSNELGQGGFGKVYKGKLQGGQEIAIKRLSRSSTQGLKEFKNELKVLAKLQHTNLVKIVGCCVERGEKIIVYEYMPNKSLDSFLSGPGRKLHLDWKERFHIVEGIVQGLLYLHKYSRLKIIHLDLKAANILLDGDLNAKISDFGMARIFGRDESQANTNRIAGTRGYMAPEYATVGTYSEKCDVFSFGVLLIEIVSGKRNNASYREDKDSPLNLVGHAWELWMEDRGLELIDDALDYGLHEKKQAMRCIHVGLLCAQEYPADRPSMTEVVAMLNNEWIRIEPPNQPAFFFGRNRIMKTDLNYDHDDKRLSFNDATISDMVAR